MHSSNASDMDLAKAELVQRAQKPKEIHMVNIHCHSPLSKRHRSSESIDVIGLPKTCGNHLGILEASCLVGQIHLAISGHI